MSCDIHLVLEMKAPDEEKWIGVHAFPWLETSQLYLSVYGPEQDPNDYHVDWRVKSRDYKLFAELARVRGETNTSMDPRGIPKDISELGKHCVDDWNGDGHSHTYMSILEFTQCFLRTRDENEKIEHVKDKLTGPDPAIERASELFGIVTDRLDWYRLIIFFDS